MKMRVPQTMEWSWPRRPLSPTRSFETFEDLDWMFDRFFSPITSGLNSVSTQFQPRCDVNETKDHYVLSMDIPGIKKEDLKIETTANQLVISGERHQSFKDLELESPQYIERNYGRFERSFTLPSSVASERIEASFENGVLNIVLPKAETAKSRTIQIQSDQSGGFLSRFLGNKSDNKKELQ